MLPFNFLDPIVAVIAFILLIFAVSLRYILVAGLFHLIFYRQSKNWGNRKLNDGNFSKEQIRKEKYYSHLSSIIFAVSGLLILILWQLHIIPVYEKLHWWDWLYFPVSLLLAMFLHETYYFWLHWWMHKPKVFRVLHRVHHDSLVTSAWTSSSFHPLECLLQAIIIPVILFVVPMHYYVMLIWLVVMTVSSVINHLDIEIYPKNFDKHWLGKWLVGATHHSLHHREFKYNYGLYFTFWDKWMHTESPTFEGKFQLVTQSTKKKA